MTTTKQNISPKVDAKDSQEVKPKIPYVWVCPKHRQPEENKPKQPEKKESIPKKPKDMFVLSNKRQDHHEAQNEKKEQKEQKKESPAKEPIKTNERKTTIPEHSGPKPAQVWSAQSESKKEQKPHETQPNHQATKEDRKEAKVEHKETPKDTKPQNSSQYGQKRHENKYDRNENNRFAVYRPDDHEPQHQKKQENKKQETVPVTNRTGRNLSFPSQKPKETPKVEPKKEPKQAPKEEPKPKGMTTKQLYDAISSFIKSNQKRDLRFIKDISNNLSDYLKSVADKYTKFSSENVANYFSSIYPNQKIIHEIQEAHTANLSQYIKDEITKSLESDSITNYYILIVESESKNEYDILIVFTEFDYLQFCSKRIVDTINERRREENIEEIYLNQEIADFARQGTDLMMREEQLYQMNDEQREALLSLDGANKADSIVCKIVTNGNKLIDEIFQQIDNNLESKSKYVGQFNNIGASISRNKDQYYVGIYLVNIVSD